MTLLGMPFEQAAISFGWGNLRDFALNLSTTSATYRALYKEHYSFASPTTQSAMLADIFDSLQMFAYMFAKAHGGKGAKPKPYPRPNADDGEKIGKDPIPIADFNKWYYGGE